MKMLQAQYGGHGQTQNLTQPLEETTTAVHIEDIHPEENDNTIDSMKLPPLQRAMAMVGIFLNTSNSLLPLFHADSLLRLVGECYARPPQQRDPVIWAAINVVFALASQQVPGGHGDARSDSPTDQTMEYLGEAQSVISTVMLSETRLVNIQALVGMVMVLQTAHDLTPALMLISATMRLAHKIGLHDHAASAHLDPVERRQHARVFWLAYILDKDLSLRTQQPSIQRDEDINMELPSSLPVSIDDNDNMAGIVVTPDGHAMTNYFLSRVTLATIEGRIYDFLYSTRAVNGSLEDRISAKDDILNALDAWRASIPPEFSASAVSLSTRNKPAISGFFCVLHATSLQCMAFATRAHAWDGKWVDGVRSHSRGIQSIKLPSSWETLVHQARNYMLLFGDVWSRDAWHCWLVVTYRNGHTLANKNRLISCPYITSMVLLLANNLYYLQHDKVQTDIKLIDSALLWLNERVRENQSEAAQALHETCVEAIRTVKRRLTEAITAPLSDTWLLDYACHSKPF